MAKFSLTGEVTFIGQTQSFGSNGFCKRDFVITMKDSKFPTPVKFTLKKDNCALADNCRIGEKVKVSFYISGREWVNPKTNTTQYFNDLEAYKIEDVKVSDDGDPVVIPEPPAELSGADEDDQMPF